MANEPHQIQWTGASGKKYTNWIYPRYPSIEAGFGNYIYAKRANDSWLAVYIGQGDLSDQNHHQIEYINSKGATHVHMHSENAEQARIAEERDLLAGNPNAYPTGCQKFAQGICLGAMGILAVVLIWGDGPMASSVSTGSSCPDRFLQSS